jgi:hypothetical protein
MAMRWIAVLAIVPMLALAGCGSAPEKPPETPRSEAKAKHKARKGKSAKSGKSRKSKSKRKTEAPPPYPVRCAKKKGECLPPADWVKKLCNDIYPDLALHLFAPSTPWKRLYMTARAEPFNASGGMSLMGDPMRPGEEVIALARREDSGRIQMGDTAGYDVFRWNGACATIHDGDFTTEEPNEVRHANIEWRRLGLPLRLALEAEPSIGEVYETRHSKCRGKSIGKVSRECVEYDGLLTAEVVRYVRNGGKVPKPTKVP